jgi:hypothetical protein
MTETEKKTDPEKPARDWQQIEEQVRAAWQAEPESQKTKTDILAPKEITVRHRAWPWIVRGLIVLLVLTVAFGAVVAIRQERMNAAQAALPQFAAGPAMDVLPTPAVLGGAQGPESTATAEPALRPDEYRVFSATPPATP